MTIKIGDKFVSNQGQSATVIDYLNNKNITIEYSTGTRQIIQGANLKRGRFKDPMQPLLRGVGVLGVEYFSCKEASYLAWSNMLKRVTNPKPGAEQEAYSNCSVCADWLYLPNFKNWYESQMQEKGYQLDKDLLLKGNKVYCPEFCCLIPQELNKFLTNRTRKRGNWPIGVSYKTANAKWDAKLSVDSRSVYLGLFTTPEAAFNAYKIAKEAEARRLADLWESRVDSRVVEALRKFEVSMDD